MAAHRHFGFERTKAVVYSMLSLLSLVILTLLFVYVSLPCCGVYERVQGEQQGKRHQHHQVAEGTESATTSKDY